MELKPFLFSFVFLLLSVALVSLVSASYGQNAYGAGYYGAEPVSYAGGTPGGAGAAPVSSVNQTQNATTANAPGASTPPAAVTGGTGGEAGGGTTGKEQPTAGQAAVQPSAGGSIGQQISQFATKSPAVAVVIVAVIVLGILWLVRSKIGL